MKTIAFATLALLAGIATAQAEGADAYGKGTERAIDVVKVAPSKSTFTLQLGPVRAAAPIEVPTGESMGTRRDVLR